MLISFAVVRVEACFIYAMKIVPPQDGRHGATWAAEAEPDARGVRRVSKSSSPVCARSGIISVWNIHLCHYFVCQEPSLYLPMVLIRYFSKMSSCDTVRVC